MPIDDSTKLIVKILEIIFDNVVGGIMTDDNHDGDCHDNTEDRDETDQNVINTNRIKCKRWNVRG